MKGACREGRGGEGGKGVIVPYLSMCGDLCCVEVLTAGMLLLDAREGGEVCGCVFERERERQGDKGEIVCMSLSGSVVLWFLKQDPSHPLRLSCCCLCMCHCLGLCCRRSCILARV